MMVDYLGVDPEDALTEIERTIKANARFELLKNVYTNELERAEKTIDDDKQVGLHKAYAMRVCMLYFVGNVIFVDKSVTYTNVVYLWYFEDFERIHEYNWGALIWSTCT